MTTSDHSEMQSTATETSSSRGAWFARLVLVIVAILAITPPALVVADMWFRKLPAGLDGGMWCQVPFLCSSVLPSYFAIILGCFFILAIILFFLRDKMVVVHENSLSLFENQPVSLRQMRIGFGLLLLSGAGMAGVIVLSLVNQRWPGWDLVIVWLMYLLGWALRAVPVTMLVDHWKRDGAFWISLLLMAPLPAVQKLQQHLRDLIQGLSI